MFDLVEQRVDGERPAHIENPGVHGFKDRRFHLGQSIADVSSFIFVHRRVVIHLVLDSVRSGSSVIDHLDFQ